MKTETGFYIPMVTMAKFLNVTDATNAIRNFERQPQGDSQAIMVGQFLQPVEQVPALQHFRLVHESPGKSPDITVYDNSGAENLNLVKVFEFVKGAHIRGKGTIELQLVTNTGRTFMYRQESNNGEFIVPYSTVNNPYEVSANGKYHIIGTNIAIDVTEKDIQEGKIRKILINLFCHENFVSNNAVCVKKWPIQNCSCFGAKLSGFTAGIFRND